MKKKLKLGVVIAIVAVLFLGKTLFAISNNLSKNHTYSTSSINTKEFSELDAISILIKNHPDFPVKPSEVITKKLPIGGPPGTTANVKFSTSLENVKQGTYMITLTKDWGITVNGKYARSFWKYKVTSSSITLTDSIDNDYLPNIMK